MAENMGTAVEASSHRQGLTRTVLRGAVVLAMGCFVLAAPFFAGTMTFLLIGVLAIVSGVLEMLKSLRAPDDAQLSSASAC